MMKGATSPGFESKHILDANGASRIQALSFFEILLYEKPYVIHVVFYKNPGSVVQNDLGNKLLI